MSKINLLDIHVANLIAAGEVVERPSSALKELVENSIDAGASVITVEIKNGGVVYMRVTDNGEGMTAEDLGRCILRHSTSKIASEGDLSKIKTLGFRGEALAAISSVSDMKIFTKHKDGDTGYLLETSSGQNTKIIETGCAFGTTVVIERLFAKVPARQKFMKRDATEGMYCKSVIEKIALSNPAVSIRFIQDGKEKIFTPGGGSYKNTVYAIYKNDVGDTLIPIVEVQSENSRKASRVNVSGFICRIEDCKNTRADENFFVNGRYIRSKTMLAAVEEAYDSVSETGKFPLCVLYIAIDESAIDVNVHPQKMEVKFENEREIFEAVYYAVKNTLQQSGFRDLAEEYEEDEQSEEEDYVDDDNNQYADKNLAVPIAPAAPAVSVAPMFTGGKEYEHINTNKNKEPQVEIITHNFDSPEDLNDLDNFSENEDKINRESTAEPVFFDSGDKFKFIGEVFYGYILIQKDEKMIIIDKHAAHERILYDLISARANGEVKRYNTQILLISEEIKLSPREAAGMLEFKDDIEKIGIVFELKEDDSSTVVVSEVPTAINDVNIGDIIREMAYMFAEENNFMAHETALEKLIEVTARKTTACRKAMKSGIRDEPEHLMWLAERVLEYEHIKYCPHGRPVAFEMTKNELEKQFKR